MTCLSLYSGIGCHDAGFRAAGIRIVAQVEIEPMPRAVLERHFPEAKRYKDVRDVSAELIRRDCGRIDIITGGFACQDISVAGRAKGLAKFTRSGITWRNMFRLIRGLRPDWVVIENVPALRTRGYDRIADVLERIDYTVRPVVVGAEHCGLPHKRHRVWIVGCLDYPNRQRRRQAWWRRTEGNRGGEIKSNNSKAEESGSLADHPRHTGEQWPDRMRTRSGGHVCAFPGGCWRCGNELADADTARQGKQRDAAGRTKPCNGGDVVYPSVAGLEGHRTDTGEPERHQPWSPGLPLLIPARPGQPQHEWEAPRLVEWTLDATASGDARELVRHLSRVSGRDDAWIEAWWARNKVRVERRLNKEILKAAGNANPPFVPYLIAKFIRGGAA